MTIRYEGHTQGRGISGKLWAKLPRDVPGDNNRGFFCHEDFETYLAAQSPYDVGASDTNPVLSDTEHTTIECATGGTDNHQSGLWLGSSDKGYHMKFNSSGGHKAFGEMRFKVSSIADQALLMGFMDPAFGAADPLTDDSGAIADKDFVGARVLTADPDGLDIVHNKNGGGGEVVVENAAHTLVADTWAKFGMLFDPKDNEDKLIRFFINGSQVATLTDLTVATFPDDVHMVWGFAIKTGEAVTKILYVDWVQIAYLIGNFV